MPPKGKGKRRQVLSAQLKAQGFAFPFPVDDLLDRAIRAGTDDTFSLAYSMIISSKRFRKHYPGIFRPNGTLRMTPAQFESYVDGAQAAASSAGLTMSRRQVGRAIARGQSAEELDFRIQASKTIKANAGHLNAFNRELKARGLKPLSSADELFDFLSNRGDEQVYRVYEASSAAAAAAAAGTPISVRRSRDIADRTAGVSSTEDLNAAFGEAAAQGRFADAELRSFGLSRRDVEDLALGIGSESKRARLQQALNQREAALQTDQVQRGLELSEQNRPILRGPQQEAGA